MSNIYTPEVLQQITKLRDEGYSWAETAKAINKEQNINKTANAMRKAYNSYCDDDGVESETALSALERSHRARLSAKAVRKENNLILENLMNRDGFLDAMKLVVKDVKKAPKVKMIPRKKGTHMTAELLFSDLQIGKLMPTYNTEICKKRIEAYTQAALFKIKQHQKSGYVFDKIVFAMLGDIIESDKKHPNSARATDTSTAEQVKNAIEYIYTLIIEPLADIGIPLEVVCVTGNHDHDDHGLAQFAPGKNHLSWPMYHAMKMLSEARGYKNVSFAIPEGAFHIHEIYGHNILYEHGVGVSCAEQSMFKRRAERSQQIGKGITYFRMGDKHNISRFNEDTLVVNGAFFGGDDEGMDYSGINGYSSQPGQIMFFHVPREDNRLPIYDSFIVQLSHIN